jgi:hypothetical protein
MTDYIYAEIETDRLSDIVAHQRERVTVLPDEANDIPINEAVAACQRISTELHRSIYETEGGCLT